MSNCSCFSPEMMRQAIKGKKSSLHKALCPVCGKEYTTNQKGDEIICFDCNKSGKSNEGKGK